MRRMLYLIASAALVYFCLCLGAFLFQDRLVYFPGGEPRVDPSALGLAFEERSIRTSDEVLLHAWWVPARDQRGAVLVSHGNAGSIEGRLSIARAFHELGLGVLLYDYRGFGRSEGRPSEQGTYRDAEAAYDELVQRIGIAPAQLVLYGESLGGAVAVELARHRPAAALVVESSFTSLPDVGARAAAPAGRDRRYDSIEKIGALELPILLVHSPADEIVPFAHAERLRDATGGRAELLVGSGDHNAGGVAASAELRARVGDFVERALRAARADEGG